MDALTYSPVLFARVLKPGRSVGGKFASRYYDSIGYGVLLYPENLLDGTPEGYAQAICLDHTSFLPSPTFPPLKLEEDGQFRLLRNGQELFSFDRPALNMIEDALVEATRLLYIRTGDLIATELAARKPLATRPDAPTASPALSVRTKSLIFGLFSKPHKPKKDKSQILHVTKI